MKIFIILLPICIAQTGLSQMGDDAKYFYCYKENADSSFKSFMSILKECNYTQNTTDYDCTKASENVGDYYYSKGDYIKAISYYDSADTKYRDKLISCGHAYFIDFIPRQYKVALCYQKMNNLHQSLSTLTPYLFDRFSSYHFDSVQMELYTSLLTKVYTVKEIKSKLKYAINNVEYTTKYRWTKDSTARYLIVHCIFKIFDCSIDFAGFETSEENGKIPFFSSKEFRISLIKQLPIYKRLAELNEENATFLGD